MQDCVFCAIVERRVSARIVLEMPGVICFLPPAALVAGHTLIVSRTHYHDLMDTPSSLGPAIFEAAQLLAGRYHGMLRTSGFNLLHASGSSAGQTVPHLHFHFLPRAEGDGVSLWPQLPGSSADLDALLRWADEPGS